MYNIWNKGDYNNILVYTNLQKASHNQLVSFHNEIIHIVGSKNFFNKLDNIDCKLHNSWDQMEDLGT